MRPAIALVALLAACSTDTEPGTSDACDSIAQGICDWASDCGKTPQSAADCRSDLASLCREDAAAFAPVDAGACADFLSRATCDYADSDFEALYVSTSMEPCLSEANTPDPDCERYAETRYEWQDVCRPGTVPSPFESAQDWTYSRYLECIDGVQPVDPIACEQLIREDIYAEISEDAGCYDDVPWTMDPWDSVPECAPAE